MFGGVKVKRFLRAASLLKPEYVKVTQDGIYTADWTGYVLLKRETDTDKPKVFEWRIFKKAVSLGKEVSFKGKYMKVGNKKIVVGESISEPPEYRENKKELVFKGNLENFSQIFKEALTATGNDAMDFVAISPLGIWATDSSFLYLNETYKSNEEIIIPSIFSRFLSYFNSGEFKLHTTESMVVLELGDIEIGVRQVEYTIPNVGYLLEGLEFPASCEIHPQDWFELQKLSKMSYMIYIDTQHAVAKTDEGYIYMKLQGVYPEMLLPSRYVRYIPYTQTLRLTEESNGLLKFEYENAFRLLAPVRLTDEIRDEFQVVIGNED